MRTDLLKSSLVLAFMLLLRQSAFAQLGSSPTNPYVIYPSTSCTNLCGQQYCGNMQCPTGDCGAFITAAGSSAGLDPSCSTDDERTQNVIWFRVHATTTTFTINNGKPYVGSGAANANQRDYAVYSGLPGNFTQIACGTVAGNALATVSGLTAGIKYYVMVSPPSTNPTANATSVCFTAPVGYAASGNTCATALSLTTNVTYTMTNAGATANPPICAGSVENEVWYRWCAPANWPAGQMAFLSVSNQVCNSNQGLQLSVWNTNSACPTVSTDSTVFCQNPGTTTSYYYQWVPNAGSCYIITVDGFAGTACEFRLTVGSSIVLPIELLSFDVKDLDGSAEILWATASETNNEHFTVERSSNGIEFEAVATFPGAGTTSELHSYRMIDQRPLPGISFYRIRQTDYDGKYSISDIVSFRNKGNVKNIRLVPNPAEDQVTVVIPDGIGASSVSVQDVSGRIVAQREVGSDLTAIMDVSGLSKGMYIVRVIGAAAASTEQLVLR